MSKKTRKKSPKTAAGKPARASRSKNKSKNIAQEHVQEIGRHVGQDRIGKNHQGDGQKISQERQQEIRQRSCQSIA